MKKIGTILCAMLICICNWISPAEAYSFNDNRNPVLPHTDIVLDAGHGGIDGGTVYGDILEKDINLDIAKKTYDLLIDKKFRVILNRSDDHALSDDNRWLKNRSRHLRDLAQRKQLANEMNVKILVSIHANSSRNRHESGAIVLHQKKDESKLLSSYLQKELNQITGVPNKSVYGKKYYLLKFTKCPAVIVEVGFLTNETDRKRMTSEQGQKQIAEALVKGIDRYLKEVLNHP